jgi:hypothetical protein
MAKNPLLEELYYFDKLNVKFNKKEWQKLLKLAIQEDLNVNSFIRYVIFCHQLKKFRLK